MGTAVILEDDALSAMALSALLEEHGFRVYSAQNATSALEVLEHVVPDLLVADWNLNGHGASLDVARSVRVKNPRAQIVFVSGYPEDAIRHETSSLGPCDVFQKPLNYDSFFAQVLGSQQAADR
jgi:DNA-binding response OmpR family regulator